VVPSHQDDHGVPAIGSGTTATLIPATMQLYPWSQTLPCPPAVAEARRLPRLTTAADRATTGEVGGDRGRSAGRRRRWGRSD